MSVRFGICHQRDEIVEKRNRVVWTGCSFGMELYAERATLACAQTFNALIVQVDVRYFDVGRKTVGAHGKAVVVRRDLDAASYSIFHRLIAAAMTELEFVRFPTERQPQNLMAEADSEDRHAPEKLTHGVNGVGYRGRIAWPVREKNAIGFEREHLSG